MACHFVGLQCTVHHFTGFGNLGIDE